MCFLFHMDQSHEKPTEVVKKDDPPERRIAKREGRTSEQWSE
jgi:hypothetical protein